EGLAGQRQVAAPELVEDVDPFHQLSPAGADRGGERGGRQVGGDLEGEVEVGGRVRADGAELGIASGREEPLQVELASRHAIFDVECPRRVGMELPDVADELARSEEHTSELQSRENLVCRLLLDN